MVLGGPSKARKSWSLIDLMLSVSTGTPWWGFPTRRGRALYLNFELPPFALQYRITRIAAAKEISDFTGFDIWNLRGHATDFSALIPKILGRIRDTGYSLILIDPIYKGLGSRNENDAGDIASLLNEVEQLALKSGAAAVFGAHFSKGNQAGKESIDRIGGSGVFARDPDVILTMTPHEEDDAHVIDLTLRALPPVKPFVVRWCDRSSSPTATLILRHSRLRRAVPRTRNQKGRRQPTSRAARPIDTPAPSRPCRRLPMARSPRNPTCWRMSQTGLPRLMATARSRRPSASSTVSST